jgi:hypothetical protein
LKTFLSPEVPMSTTDIFFFHCNGLWFPLYCYGWFFQFSFFDFIIWLPYCPQLFQIINTLRCQFISNFATISLHILKFSWTHTHTLMFLSSISTLDLLTLGSLM